MDLLPKLPPPRLNPIQAISSTSNRLITKPFPPTNSCWKRKTRNSAKMLATTLLPTLHGDRPYPHPNIVNLYISLAVKLSVATDRRAQQTLKPTTTVYTMSLMAWLTLTSIAISTYVSIFYSPSPRAAFQQLTTTQPLTRAISAIFTWFKHVEPEVNYWIT